MLQYFDDVAGLQRVKSRSKTQDGAKAGCRMMAESKGIPKTTIHCILSDDLKEQKPCARLCHMH